MADLATERTTALRFTGFMAVFWTALLFGIFVPVALDDGNLLVWAYAAFCVFWIVRDLLVLWKLADA